MAYVAYQGNQLVLLPKRKNQQVRTAGRPGYKRW